MGKPAHACLVIFGDSSLVSSVMLTEKALRLAGVMGAFRVAAICDASSQRRRRCLPLAASLPFKSVLKRLFDPTRRVFIRKEMLWDLQTVGRRYGVDVVSPPAWNINHPQFITHLRTHLKPDFALSFGCPQIFGRDLLDVFEAAVNCHSGLLPDYRGWAATEWSVYCGERSTGFSYHYMSGGIDTGPLLACGTVKVTGHSVFRLTYEKARIAANRLDTALEAVFARHPGIAQAGNSRYFGREATRRIRTIARPSKLTWKEIQRRLRSFGTLWMRLDKEFLEVTRLRRLESGEIPPRGRSFITADGIPVAATRFAFLPFWLFQLTKSARV